MKARNERLRTAIEAHDQIRWDRRLDPGAFTLVLSARPSGTKEIPFDSFVPGGDIPWHRVLQLRHRGELVWCREGRIDRLDELARTSTHVRPEAPAEAPLAPPEAPAAAPPTLAPLAPHAFSGGSWRPGSQPAAGPPASPPAAGPPASPPAAGPSTAETTAAGPPAAGPWSLRVATFNVLFDLYDADLIDTPRRTEAALTELEAIEADLLALVEVTPGFLARLLASPWVQQRYVVSDGPEGSSVQPHGVVLLSRYPLRSAAQCTLLAGRRRALVARVDGPGGPIEVAVAHLASNASEDAEERRQREARALLSALAWLAPSHPVILLGDLNAATDLDPLLAAAGLVDAWTTTRPGEPGATFDPARNALAALISRSGRAARYDRILCRGAALRPAETRLFATDPLGTTGLFTSDHFGLLARLEVDARSAPLTVTDLAARSAPLTVTDLAPPVAEEPRKTDLSMDLDTLDPTYHSALVLIPPAELWGPIQAIRAQHDRGFGRWMPHISLIYGFVPDQAFEAAARRVAEVTRSFEPFILHLSRTRRFEHGGSTTLWLAPEPAGPLQKLQAALAQRFPRCREKGRDEFTPHLTIARAPKAQQATLDALERRLMSDEEGWKPQCFVVCDIQLISRRGEEPFVVRHQVSLGRPPRAVSLPTTTAPLPPTPPTASAPGPVAAPATSAPAAASTAPTASAPTPSTAAASAPDPFDPPVDPPQLARREEVRAAVARAVQQLAASRSQPMEIETLGSARLTPRLPSSDLDLLVIAGHRSDTTPLAPALLDALLALRPFTSGRLAGGRVPALRLVAGDLGLDLMVVELPPGVTPGPSASIPEGTLGHLDEGARLALLGPRENDALLALAAPRVALFPAVLSALKRWAEARGLRAPSCGYPGGFSLATLAAHACAHAPPKATTTGAVLRFLFETFASWKWPAPLALGPAPVPAPERRDVMPILTPLAPRRNSARTVTPATRAVLTEELSRAGQLMRQILSHRAAPAELFAPLDPATLGRPRITIPPAATPEAQGLLDQRLPGLILALDREGLAPRPFRRGAGPVLIAVNDTARAHRVLAGSGMG